MPVIADNTIDVVLRRRHLLLKSKNCLFWAAINGFFIILLLIDLKYWFIGSSFDSILIQKSILIFDLLIGFILLMNVCYDLGLWFWKHYLMTEIELTSSQMKAFGIKYNEIGFKEYQPKTPINDNKFNQTVSSVSPIFDLSLSSDYEKHLNTLSLNSTNLSFGNSSTPLSNSLGGPQIDSSLNTTATSWEYNPNLSSINNSFGTSDPMNDSKTNFVRFRRNQNKVNSETIVTNGKQLNDYLKNFEVKEQRFQEMVDSEKCKQSDGTANSWISPIKINTNVEDSNQMTYQIAIDSPLRLNSPEFDTSLNSSASSKAMDSLLSKLKINESVMNQWIENIRKWLSQTIICRLIEQIDKINENLIKSGNFDAIIGETSLQTLTQLASLKKNELSTLENVLPFLQISSNQQYLVQRIRDLSKGGCIGKFIWNSGGSYNSKPWNDQTLTDSAIVMHLFRTYMDLRLPSDPNYAEGKSFTNNYFKSMTGSTPKSSVYISELKSNPPHYDVFTDDDGLWNLPIGRNNLFHSILVFLDAIKTKQMGHLGRINLGSSGINILWVVQR